MMIIQLQRVRSDDVVVEHRQLEERGGGSVKDLDQDVELWERELIAAGWTRRFPTVWKSPSGAYYRGPDGAWRAMKAGAR